MLNSVQRGLGKGCQTAVGAVLADAILLVTIMSGIGGILNASTVAFNILKWGGAIYLVYLGVKELRSHIGESTQLQTDQRNAFQQGLAITLLNPKIIGFFVAFFPQFLDKDKDVVQQLLIMGPVFLVTVLFWFLLTAVFARSVSSIMESYKGRVAMKYIAGLSLLACGLFATTMERM
jgi:threonine/homoserine/homoserine lactone efflux protein